MSGGKPAFQTCESFSEAGLISLKASQDVLSYSTEVSSQVRKAGLPPLIDLGNAS
jgi:hypothetical protein